MSLTRPVTKIRMPATTKELAAMLEEASRTARKLPPAGPRGYASIWPQIPRSASEKFAADDRPVFFPPGAAAIDRMLACFEWVSALDEEQRHLLWKRASHEPWKDICAWMGCDRTTAWRRWNGALEAALFASTDATAPKKPGNGPDGGDETPVRTEAHDRVRMVRAHKRIQGNAA